MNASGHRIRVIFATGGDAKNPVFVREHADATGCPMELAEEPEAVLLGAAILAILGAVASGDQPSIVAAMGAMSRAASVVQPAGGEIAAHHEAKHRVFLRMYHDQMAYRSLMAS